MKKLKKPTFKIFSFKGVTTDFLYEKHLKLFKPTPTEFNDDKRLEFLKKTVEKKQSTPRRQELTEKYQYFVHLLITRSFNKGLNTFNSSLLQDIFGNLYLQMINTLSHLGYIYRSPFFEIGKSAQQITLLKTNTICRERYDSSFEKYRNKHLKLMEPYQKNMNEKITSELGVDFVKQYKQNLRKLKIVDEAGARSFIDMNNSSSDYGKQSYHWILDKYISTEFDLSIDNDKRIYTVLTSTQKDLKNYVNIKYQLDISNSAPLLFSYNIIDKYNISKYILNLLYNININTISSSHYDTKVFRKQLKDNHIRFNKKDEVKLDHLFYIYLTFHGKFWDVFLNMENNSNTLRHILKKKLFKEVFYSRIIGGRKMMYATQFKQVFPSVYKLILNHRKMVKNGTTQHLSHDMMSLECEIIQNILKEMYRKGYSAVNIHDAIVVLDTKENTDLSPNEVEVIIKNEYLKYNLYSSCKVEYFSPTIAEVKLKTINENEQKIKNLIEEMRKLAFDQSNPNRELDMDLFNEIMNGQSTIEFNEHGIPILIQN